MLKVILIDDEPKAIKSLEWAIANYCENVEILETFTDPKKAATYIKYNNPDCIFLDVQMPKMDGFQLLDNFQKRNFSVVFTTAYNQYAIKAIKENAMDYLLKPIDKEEFKITIEKLKAKKRDNRNYDFLEEQLRSRNDMRIGIPVEGKLVFLNADEIIYCESDGNYCKINLVDKKPLFISKTLKEVENLLPEQKFFRVHNSYIINLKKVIEYLKTQGYVILDTQKEIPVSRNKKSEFLEKV
ncbi:MAG TPA: LytTR family DNA-binding domain-containing protein [Flavobacteriaceae bacterium]|nr:LytTR family DNA-binding domain-containing protein [Flavobacteriaceae bacterium]